MPIGEGRFRPIADVQDRLHLPHLAAYSDLDPTIARWVTATGSTLFTEWAGEPSRYFHLPGEPPFACFQIVVFPPADADVIVQAASIDTNDKAELMQLWEGPVATLDDMLALAVPTVEQWKVRQRGQTESR